MHGLFSGWKKKKKGSEDEGDHLHGVQHGHNAHHHNHHHRRHHDQSSLTSSTSRKASDASLYSVTSTVSSVVSGALLRSGHQQSPTLPPDEHTYDPTANDAEHYNQLLDEAKTALLEMIYMDGWKLESGKNLEEGIIYSQNIKKFGRKIFKLQRFDIVAQNWSYLLDGYTLNNEKCKHIKYITFTAKKGVIDMAPHDLWHDMVTTLNDSPKWNPTILESRTIQVIDDNKEITYNVSAEAAGGLVSARDFINVRHWLQIKPDMYLSYGIGCTHADMPVQKKYVRGDNGPGGWVFESVENEPDRCLFTWIVNTNLKGWLPQAAIDQAMSGVLVSYFKLLVNHYKELIEQRTNGV